MSKFRVVQFIVHSPSFTEYQIGGSELLGKLQALGFKVPMGMLDGQYFYTDLEGWGKVLFDLAFKSSLYKPERFDCDNYALKAMNICAERYGLNTLAFVIGNMPQGRHAFNMVYHGDGFMFWEPNDGFPYSGSLFGIGEFGYQPEIVLL